LLLAITVAFAKSDVSLSSHNSFEKKFQEKVLKYIGFLINIFILCFKEGSTKYLEKTKRAFFLSDTVHINILFDVSVQEACSPHQVRKQTRHTDFQIELEHSNLRKKDDKLVVKYYRN